MKSLKEIDFETFHMEHSVSNMWVKTICAYDGAAVFGFHGSTRAGLLHWQVTHWFFSMGLGHHLFQTLASLLCPLAVWLSKSCIAGRQCQSFWLPPHFLAVKIKVNNNHRDILCCVSWKWVFESQVLESAPQP